MREFIENISLNAPLFASDESFIFVLAVSVTAGVALGIYRRVVYGKVPAVGFLVGSIGLLFLWALVLAASVALPIGVFFYIDENSFVTAAEFEEAAANRNIDLQEMFSGDPDASEIMAEIANLGIEDSSNDWPDGSPFQGIPKRVLENAIRILVGGYLTIGIMVLGIIY